MKLAAVPKTEQAVTPSGGVAAGRPQPLFHLVEKPPDLFNLQAITGQQGVQDRVIEKVIERGLRACLTDFPCRLLKAAKRRLGCGQTRTVRNTRLMGDAIRAT
jgi:hypothetical protein